jgi:hypothetical protein
MGKEIQNAYYFRLYKVFVHLLSNYFILINFSNGEILAIKFVDTKNLKTAPVEVSVSENINLKS